MTVKEIEGGAGNCSGFVFVGARLKCHPTRKVEMTSPSEADPINETASLVPPRDSPTCSSLFDRDVVSPFFNRGAFGKRLL
jgi:hypothetical protein